MQITKIHYEFCANLGNFSNEKVRMEAELSPEDDLDASMEGLKQQVHAVTHSREEYDKMRGTFWKAKEDLSEMAKSVEAMRQKYNQTVEFMTKQGLKGEWDIFPIPDKPLLQGSDQPIDGELEW